jgi:hypothetical protein
MKTKKRGRKTRKIPNNWISLLLKSLRGRRAPTQQLLTKYLARIVLESSPGLPLSIATS